MVVLVWTGAYWAGQYQLDFTDPGFPGVNRRFFVSLPSSVIPPIADHDDLWAAITPASARVSVRKFNRLLSTYTIWDGVTCTGTVQGCGCFCIDTSAGEGVWVEVDETSGIDLVGSDGPPTITLIPPGPQSFNGMNEISLPFGTPLVDAAQLRADIGVARALNVSRWNSQNDTFTSYPPTNFNLAPGLGYRVQVSSGVTYVPAVGPVVVANSGSYQIFGSANTTSFAWQLVGDPSGTPVSCGNTAEPLVVGDPQSTIATKLATAMAASCGFATVTAGPAANALTVSGVTGGHTFRVGTTTVNCDVDTLGCNFNPTIRLVSPTSYAGDVAPSLRLTLASPSTIRLSWQASACGPEDYGIYEGFIGNWYSHTLADCTDDGGDLTEELTPSPGNTYYLVVARVESAEGSYGLTSEPQERPGASPACAPVQQLGCP
jgi:hypothetical protein